LKKVKLTIYYIIIFDNNNNNMSNTLPISTHIIRQSDLVINNIPNQDIQSDRIIKKLKIASVVILTIVNICITIAIIVCNVKKIEHSNIYVIFLIITFLDNIVTWLLILFKVAHVQNDLDRNDTLTIFTKNIIILLILFILNNILLGITIYFCIIHILPNIPNNILYKSLTIFFICLCFIFRFIVVLVVNYITSMMEQCNEIERPVGRPRYELTHARGEYMDVVVDAGQGEIIDEIILLDAGQADYVDKIIVEIIQDDKLP